GVEAGSSGLDFGLPESAATHPRWSFDKATPRKGSLATRSRICFAGKIAISSAKGSCERISFRIAAADALPRTTKVPAAPMLTMSRCFRFAASFAGRKAFLPPTLAARRKTTCAIESGLAGALLFRRRHASPRLRRDALARSSSRLRGFAPGAHGLRASVTRLVDPELAAAGKRDLRQ